MFIKSSLIYLDTLTLDKYTITHKMENEKLVTFLNGSKVVDSFYCNYNKKRRKTYGMTLCMVTADKMYNFIGTDRVFRYTVK